MESWRGSCEKMKGAKKELVAKYRAREKEIEARLLHFKKVGLSGPQALFEELVFCILTPQSKAFSCDEAVRELKGAGLLYRGSVARIASVLRGKSRFHNNKAKYIVEAREKFSPGGFRRLSAITFTGSERMAREALLKSVKGIGWKEASHYMRNVGRGETVAILDRHILRNLARYGAIGKSPKSLTPKRYAHIEKRMSSFCRKIGIPMARLDLLFWAEETGKVFK